MNLIEQLRGISRGKGGQYKPVAELCGEAADEIEKLMGTTTDPASGAVTTGDQRIPMPIPAMGPYEALALYLYLKDNTEARYEPQRTMLAQAWRVICTHAQYSIGERAK